MSQYKLQGRYMTDEPDVWSDEYFYNGKPLTLEEAEASIEAEKSFDTRNGMHGAYEYRAVKIDE